MTSAVLSKEYTINTVPQISFADITTSTANYKTFADVATQFTTTITAYNSTNPITAVTVPSDNNSQKTTYNITPPNKNGLKFYVYQVSSTSSTEGYYAGKSLTQYSSFTADTARTIGFAAQYNDGYDDSAIAYSTTCITLPAISVPSQGDLDTLLWNGTYTTTWKSDDYPYFYHGYRVTLPNYNSNYSVDMTTNNSAISNTIDNSGHMINNIGSYSLFDGVGRYTFNIKIARNAQSQTTQISAQRIPYLEGISLLTTDSYSWQFWSGASGARFYDATTVSGIIAAGAATRTSVSSFLEFSLTSGSSASVPLTFTTNTEFPDNGYLTASISEDNNREAFEGLLPSSILQDATVVTDARYSGISLKITNPFYEATLPFSSIDSATANPWDFSATPSMTNLSVVRAVSTTTTASKYSSDIFENDQFLITGRITSPRQDQNQKFQVYVGDQLVISMALTLDDTEGTHGVSDRYSVNYSTLATALANTSKDITGCATFKFDGATVSVGASDEWTYRKLSDPVFTSAATTYSLDDKKVTTAVVMDTTVYSSTANLSILYNDKYTGGKELVPDQDALGAGSSATTYSYLWPDNTPNTIYVQPICTIAVNRTNESNIPKSSDQILTKFTRANLVIVYRMVPNLHWAENAIAINNDTVDSTSIVDFNAVSGRNIMRFVNGTQIATIALNVGNITLDGFILDGGDWVKENPSVVGFVADNDSIERLMYTNYTDTTTGTTDRIYGLPWRDE